LSENKNTHEADLLVIDDDLAVSELFELYAEEIGFTATRKSFTATDGLKSLPDSSLKLIVLDLGLPDRDRERVLEEFLKSAGDTPIAVVTADDQVETAVKCMREGAFDFMAKPLSPARILSLLSHAMNDYRYRRLIMNDSVRQRSPAFSKIITAAPLMETLFLAVERLAPSPQPVLITGESGTGKELIARAVHDLSSRPGKFVPVNVAGLDGSMFSDTLFGHVKGAYTGAESSRPGLAKRAEGGTLFLDEIGDLNIESQVKLLRFLQENEYYPLGTDQPEKSSCRVVLATHVDLFEAVRQKKFREDLYYRLAAHSVIIPPLRERPGDLPLLVDHFLREASLSLNIPAVKIDKNFIPALSSYEFPGNIRELSAIITGAASAASDGRLSTVYLHDYMKRHKNAEKTLQGCPDYHNELDGRLLTLSELEEMHVSEALRRTDYNQSAAAALLGISQSTISRRFQHLMHNA